MTENIPSTILETMILAGSIIDSQPESAITFLDRIKRYDYVNRLAPDSWYLSIDNLSSLEIVAILKALTILEKDFHWLGGSVSGIIWTYRVLEARDSRLTIDIAEWILARTNNDYVPFGTHNYGARSLQEYRFRREQRQKQRDARNAEIAAAHERALAAKTERLASGEAREKIQKERATQRIAELSKLEVLSPLEKLRIIADDRNHVVDYYPDKWSIVNQATIDELEEPFRFILEQKLQGRRKGPWHRLYKKLKKNNVE